VIRLTFSLFFSFCLLFFSSCNDGKSSKFTDKPTGGEITIVADESYEPLVQVQIDTFTEIYKYAKIHVRYLPEAEVFNQLLNNDTIRLAIVSRELSADEKMFFDKQKIIPRTLKIAEDAIALIIHPANNDTILSYEQLEGIVTGRYAVWSDLGNEKNKDSILVVFDKSGSANARYLKETFLGKKDFSKNVFAAKSNRDVVDYAAIGVIGLNWISDRDDSTSAAFLNSVRVIALSMPDTSAEEKAYNKPLQAYIALKTYPLTRGVYMISREGRNGLGTGFASFVAGDKGQRMIRMMGLLPATMPIRIVKVNPE
jgi:phosphate transport system substrate-binding protein